MSFKIEILLIPLPQAISHIFEISEDDHPLKFVGHAIGSPTSILLNDTSRRADCTCWATYGHARDI